ncbi:MAG: homoserine kinase [Acidobacteriota bacterium]
MSPTTTIQVPASTTNLGAGFDALGMALQLYLHVDISLHSCVDPLISLQGEGAEELPTDEQNLIWRVMRYVFEKEGGVVPSVHLRVSNQIPLARGLGSSAAAIVAGIACYEALSGRQLESQSFFRHAFAFETHPDNLAAARYGGFTVSCVGEQGKVTFGRFHIDPKLHILIVVPEFQLSTEKARAAIPKEVNLRQAVFNLQRSALAVAALLGGEFGLLHEALRDQIHQPYRAPLIPGFPEVLALNDEGLPGLLGLALSGAGPSVLVLAEFNVSGIYDRIRQVFEGHGISCRRFDLGVDNVGRTIQQDSNGQS